MISVPLFFFVSGFLFFYKVDFCKDVYKKKIHTLLSKLRLLNAFPSLSPIQKRRKNGGKTEAKEERRNRNGKSHRIPKFKLEVQFSGRGEAKTNT